MKIMKRNRARRRACGVVAAAVLAVLPAVSSANTTYTWNGATTSGFGTFNRADNWLGDVSPPTSGSTSDLLFGSLNAHSYTPTLDTSYSENSLTFNSSALAFTIALNGNTFTIGAGGITDNAGNTEIISSGNVALGASEPWNVAGGSLTVSTPINFSATALSVNTSVAGGTATLSGALSGNTSASINKNGPGTLVLSGGGNIQILQANAGTTQISAGSLALSTAGINSILNINGGALTTGVLTGNASGSISVTDPSVGTALTINAASGSSTYSGSVSGTGTVLKTGASTQIFSGGSNLASGTITAGGGNLQVSGAGTKWTASTGVNVNANGTLTITGGGSVVTPFVQFGGSPSTLNVSGGSLTTGFLYSVANGYGSILLTDPASGPALTLNGASSGFGYSGNISGTGSLLKTGGSSELLTGSNTFTGGVNVSGGTLTMGSGMASSYLVTGGTLSLGFGNFGSGSTNTTLEADPGGTVIYGASSLNNATLSGGGIHNVSAVSQYMLVVISSGTTITPANGSTLAYTTDYGTVNISSGTTVNGNDFTVDGTCNVNGTANFSNLSGNSGTLNINGAANVTGYFFGYGTINGTLNLASGAYYAGGASPPLILNSGSNFIPGNFTTSSPGFGPSTVASIQPAASGNTSSGSALTLNANTTATVNGTDLLTLTGTLSGSGSLTKAGTGALILSSISTLPALNVSGGVVQITSGSLQLTQHPGAVYPLTVTSGSTLDISGGSAAASVTALSVYIDAYDQSTTTYSAINLTGSNSMLTAGFGIVDYGTLNVSQGVVSIGLSSSLQVGEYGGGTGTVAISAGGTVTALTCAVAGTAGAYGTVTIDGAGSSLNCVNSLILGNPDTNGFLFAGAGSVTLTNGGILNVGSVLFNSPSSSITVGSGGGTIITGSLTSGNTSYGAISLTDPPGGYALTLNGSSGTSTYSGAMSGTGSLLKTGASTQNLSGANTFTGLVTVNAGTLNLSTGAAAVYDATNATTLIFDFGNFGLSTLEADPGSTLIFNASTLSGGSLVGTGTHNVSAVTRFQGTSITSGASITPSNNAALFSVNSAGNITISRIANVTWTGGSNAGGNINLSGQLTVSGFTSSGTIQINALGELFSTNSSLVLLGGSETSIAFGGGINAVGGNPINLDGALLVNNGFIINGAVNVNFGSVATGTGNYVAGVTVNPGGSLLPGVYGSASPGALVSSTAAAIQPAGSGATVFTAPVTVNADAVITVNGTDSLKLTAPLTAGGYAVDKFGTGTVTLLPFGAGSLNISAGAMQLSTSTVPLQLSTVAIAAGAALDMTTDSAILGGSSLSMVNALVQQGFNGGRWNGSGIASSSASSNTQHLTAIGVIQNNQSGTAIYSGTHLFEGVAVFPANVLVKYTYYGDTNLDGKVDGSDYSRIDSAFIADKTNPTAVTGWFNGDFNYDGVINGSDYTLMDNAFNTQGALISAEFASPTAQLAGATGTAAVPEPASLALLGLGALGLVGRRRKWKSGNHLLGRMSFDAES